MALFGRKKTTVGLDIGSGLIKVAVVDHGRAQPELVKVAIVPLLADAIVEGEIMDPGIVSDAIRAALSSLDGLLTAEIEFPSEAAARAFSPPPWLGEEVTGDATYANQNLATLRSAPGRPPG